MLKFSNRVRKNNFFHWKFSSKITKWVFRRVEEALAAAKKMDDQLKKVISCATPERTSCLSKDALTMDDVLTKMMDL